MLFSAAIPHSILSMKGAQAVIAKVQPTKIALESLVASANFPHVPQVVSAPAEKALTTLKTVVDTANEIIDNEGAGDVPVPDSKVLHARSSYLLSMSISSSIFLTDQSI